MGIKHEADRQSGLCNGCTYGASWEVVCGSPQVKEEAIKRGISVEKLIEVKVKQDHCISYVAALWFGDERMKLPHGRYLIGRHGILNTFRRS